MALCVALSSHSEGATGEGAAAQRAVPTFEQRFAFGVGDTRNMQLELLGAGVKWRLTPTLDVLTVALATFTAGGARVGEPARAGYGGELTLRLRPWPKLAVQPFAYSSIGLLLFARQPFLPGADVYEGILSSGLGLETQLTPQLSLGAKAFTVHLSNGQGLGPFNPALDLGIGFDRLGQATFGDDHSDPYFDLEWAFPWSDGNLCSLFLALDAGRSLRDMDRSRSLRRLR
jgi:hypothetical protein